tara:strand:- start:499 stop:942 length:444 start_codon:yes stop_codon:yes gene_type:complete
MEDQVPSSQEYVTPGSLPTDGNYYQNPQGPRYNNPAEFDQRLQQPAASPTQAPMPDFRAMRDLAYKQAVAQVTAAQAARLGVGDAREVVAEDPQELQPQPKVVYVRRNLTVAEIILVFALSIGGILGVQAIWTLATDVLPRLEIREK